MENKFILNRKEILITLPHCNVPTDFEDDLE